MGDNRRTIRIPLEPHSVVIFPDELPVGDLDYNDIIDILRSVLAPLKLWRSCAVEYHRQGFRIEFDQVLSEIIDSLADPYVEKIYRERLDYKEGMADIFNALAAKELGDLARFKDSAANSNNRDETDCERRVVDFLGRAENQIRGHPYSYLIKGFYEIRQGEIERAEVNFKAVHSSANGSKKEYLFGALVGLGIVAYCKEKYGVAMEHFSKALQRHPKSLSSIRVVIASCCFKLNQFDRARAILEKALACDPANADVLVLLALLEQVSAQKDRSKRLECRAHAYEYCLLAREMETSTPSTMMAQNHMANHYFHTWKILIKGGDSPCTVRMLIRDQWAVELEGDGKELDIRVNDPFKINSAIFIVKKFTILGSSSSSSMGSVERVLLSLSGKKGIGSGLVGLSSESSSFLKVEVKQYGLVQTLAADVMKKTTVNPVKAESIYIIGRLFHAQNNISSAMEYYKVAYRICPELSLAVFGHAQILLSKQELGPALELFEKVLQQHPDDRDTQAYVMLVKGLHRRESSSLEKVREVATGFLHEVDLWLLQGQLRQTSPAEYASALRCYTHALECMEQQAGDSSDGTRPGGAFLAENPRVLSNIAVLHHSLGRLTVGLEFCRRALIAQQQLCDIEEKDAAVTAAVTAAGGGNGAGGDETALAVTASASASASAGGTVVPQVVNPIFKNQQFEGVFYTWSGSICSVKPDWTAAGWESGTAEKQNGAPVSAMICTFEMCNGDGSDAETETDMLSLVTPGCELLLQNCSEGEEESPVLHIVVALTPRGFTTRSHVHRMLLTAAAERSNGAPIILSVKKKIPGSNFSDTSITMSYNYARMLEDFGNTDAAKEVYVQLLKQHPSFIDCYLRLSRIARDVGRLDEASVWVSRALTVEEMDPDAGVSLGDLYAGGQRWDEAKKCYEKVIVKNIHDARTMLSLGNMYFANLSSNPERYIKDSYKFFHHVLTKDPKNVYAANGLGVVCAEKGEFDVAREIISRAREASMPLSEDICSNLAHVHLAQGRLIDAEHLYQAALKTLPRSSSSSGGSSGRHADKIVAAYECMAFAQFRNGRHTDALHSMLRGLHVDPSGLRGWYNVAVVRADYASSASKSKIEKVDDIQDASQHLLLARKLFSFLATQSTQGQRGALYSAKMAARKDVLCEHNVKLFTEQLERAKAEEDQRNEIRVKQEEEHKMRLQLKQEELNRMRQIAEESKRDQQLIAVARQKKLEELREKWIQGSTVPASSGTTKAEGGPPKKRSKKKVVTAAGDDDEERGQDDDSDNDNEGSSSPLDYLDNNDDEPASKKSGLTNIEDIFGSDDSDNDVDDPEVTSGGTKEKKESAAQGSPSVDGDEEDAPVRDKKSKSKSKSDKGKGKGKGKDKDKSNDKGRVLKRGRAGSEQSAAPDAPDDDDNDGLFDETQQDSAESEQPAAKRRSRIIAEDEDEEADN